MCASELNIGIIGSLVLHTCVSGRCQGWLWWSQEHRGWAQAAHVGLVRAANEGVISWLIKPKGLQELQPSPQSCFVSHLCGPGRIWAVELRGGGIRWGGQWRSLCRRGVLSFFSQTVLLLFQNHHFFHRGTTVFTWAQYGLSDQGPILWGKLKESSCSCKKQPEIRCIFWFSKFLFT